jgi:hypothetical protein
VLETFGFYEAMSRLGVPPAIQEFNAYDWTGPQTGRVAVLPDVRALSAEQLHHLADFVDHGNTLILSGLTGFYDDNAGAWPVLRSGPEQPLAQLTGAMLKEVSVVGDRVSTLQLKGFAAPLPTDLWESTLTLLPGTNTRAIAMDGGLITATERRFPHGGRVLWLPQTVGIGAWRVNAAPLAATLAVQLHDALAVQPFTLSGQPSGCVLRVLVNGKRSVTITANELDVPNTCRLTSPAGFRSVRIARTNAELQLGPHAVSVLLWSTAPQ